MQKPSKRTLSTIAVFLLLVWGGFLIMIGWAMRQPPEKFGRVMMHVPLPFMLVLPFETLWKHARAGRVDAGTMAPDFTLPTLDRASRVRLSSFRGSRPVVLVFGSYT